MTPIEFTDNFESLNIPMLGVRMPTFFIEEKYKKELGLDPKVSNKDFLITLCRNGFKKLQFAKNSPEYKNYAERVKYELNTFEELGFTDYILLVWDILNFCKVNNIPTGIGRGSAAGSLVLYLIEVTKIDPLKYGLYFERFVSKIRAKKTIVDGITYLDGSLMCDVDIDIDYYRRPEVLKYLEEKFMGKTAKILTFNTLSSKLVIKEVGKIFGMKPEEEMTHVTSMIPKIHGQIEDLDKAYESVKEFRDWCDENKETYDIAIKLKDLIKNKGVHPSGVMISYYDLAGNCPVELSSDKDIVSSYDMNQVSLFSLKVDILGLRGVSVVDDVCKILKINVEDIDLNHASIYESLQNLKYPHGLFQIEAELGFRTTQKVKPHNFNELSAILALARPGSMAFIDDYAKFTNAGEFQSIHPFFDDILGETGGLCLYQEQMMKMAHKVGFTLDEAEILRRIVGKKKLEEVKEWQEKIKIKVRENNLDPKIGEILWDILNASVSYSFNKCIFEEELVELRDGNKIKLKDCQLGQYIKAYNPKSSTIEYVKVKNKFYNEKPLYEVKLKNGKIIKTSIDHKFLCDNGEMTSLKDIIGSKFKILSL
jgi:DNA polymerase-3 subunit alpha